MRNMHIFLGMVSNIISNIISSILGFVSRTVFIYYLGAECLGYSGLLNNIFGFLSIAELGIGSAITFSLYDPLAKKDYKKASALMTLYRKCYYGIAIVILGLGICLLPFLDFFINSLQRPDNLEIIYLLFLINIVIGYFFSYRMTLLGADQRNYKIAHIQIIGNVITLIFQIIVLFLFKNYIIYLIVQIVCSNLSLFIQSKYITKMYIHIDFKTKDKLDFAERKTIIKNLKSIMILKLGDVCVNSTDNLIISKYINLISVGIYSNYLLIRDLVNGYIKSVFSNMTASFGNLIVSESKEKQLEMFENLMFLSFWLYGFEAVCLFTLYNPFMRIWLNDSSLIFSIDVVFLIVLNNFLTGLRIPLITIKNAAGLYYEDRIVPFVFAFVNLVASVFLVQKIGISGVIIGTIMGSMALADWYRPKVIYNRLFEKSVKLYFKNYFKYILIVIAELMVTYQLSLIQFNSNILIQFAFQMFIAVLLPNVVNYILFHSSKEFIYLKTVVFGLVKNILNKLTKRSQNG